MCTVYTADSYFKEEKTFTTSGWGTPGGRGAISSTSNCLHSLSSSSGGLFPSKMMGTAVFALEPLQNQKQHQCKSVTKTWEKSFWFAGLCSSDFAICCEECTFLLEPLQGGSPVSWFEEGPGEHCWAAGSVCGGKINILCSNVFKANIITLSLSLACQLITSPLSATDWFTFEDAANW